MKKYVVLMFFIILVSLPLALALEEIGSYRGNLNVGVDKGVVQIGPDNNESGFVCGNGIIEGNEQCDGDLNGQSCLSVVGQESTGVLSCSATCRWDTTLCTSTLPINNQTNDTTTPTNNGGSSNNGGGSGGGGGSSVFFISDNATNANSESGGSSRDNGLENEVSDEKEEEGGMSRLNGEESSNGGFNAITGAVIGALKSRRFVPILVFAVIIVAAFLIANRKRKGFAKKE